MAHRVVGRAMPLQIADVDSLHRDTARAIEQDWQVFSRGSFAQDAGFRSAVIAYRCQIEVEGVLIQPGDLIFGDMDGVLVIPPAVEQEVMQEALDKVTGEKRVRKEIEEGSTSTAVFVRYGIL